MTDSPKVHPLVRPLLLAVLFLGVAAALKLSPLDADLARRLIGILSGALVVFYSNYVPKKLSPLAAMRCDPATEQALRRFAGMSMVLGGIGYMLAWMVAPIGSAALIGGAVLGLALLLVVIRFVLAATSNPQL